MNRICGTCDEFGYTDDETGCYCADGFEGDFTYHVAEESACCCWRLAYELRTKTKEGAETQTDVQ